MTHRELLARLLPPRSYDPNATHIAAQLRVEGDALDRVQANSQIVLDSISPLSAVDTLPDWERVCGLTPETNATRQQRVDAVLVKLIERGGLSIPYFIRVSKRLGYDIEIFEYEPFYLDYSHLDKDKLYEWDVIWVWEVSIRGGAVRKHPFYLDSSSVDESLLSYQDAVIEAFLRDIKPAHTLVLFNYEESDYV